MTNWILRNSIILVGSINKFYNSSVDYGDSFLVIPICGGISGFYDKRGMWHDFN